MQSGTVFDNLLNEERNQPVEERGTTFRENCDQLSDCYKILQLSTHATSKKIVCWIRNSLFFLNFSSHNFTLSATKASLEIIKNSVSTALNIYFSRLAIKWPIILDINCTPLCLDCKETADTSVSRDNTYLTRNAHTGLYSKIKHSETWVEWGEQHNNNDPKDRIYGFVDIITYKDELISVFSLVEGRRYCKYRHLSFEVMRRNWKARKMSPQPVALQNSAYPHSWFCTFASKMMLCAFACGDFSCVSDK